MTSTPEAPDAAGAAANTGPPEQPATTAAEPVAVPRQPRPSGLEQQARQILDFERRWWRRAGAKEQAIRDHFGCSTTRYYQLLNGLLDDPAALAYDPITVTRLRRLRSWRHRGR